MTDIAIVATFAQAQAQAQALALPVETVRECMEQQEQPA